MKKIEILIALPNFSYLVYEGVELRCLYYDIFKIVFTVFSTKIKALLGN